MKRGTALTLGSVVCLATLLPGCAGDDDAASENTTARATQGEPVDTGPDKATDAPTASSPPGSAGDTSAAGGNGTDAVDIIAADLLAYPRADTSRRDARCVAEVVVDALGIDRLHELGLDSAGGAAPELTAPPMTSTEGHQLYAAYDQCLDFTQRDIDAFMTAGLSRPEARCASDRYRASAIPRVHLLLQNHDEVPHDDLHARVEALWENAQTTCRRDR